MRPGLIPFRWWGSDFLLIVTGLKEMEPFLDDAAEMIKSIAADVANVDGIAVSFHLSVGYAASGIHGEDPGELLEYAAFAEHEVMRGMASNLNPFNKERYEATKKAAFRRTFIKDIIESNQLSIVFQPILSLKTGEVFGYEALSRPQNPLYDTIVELIDDAETSGHYPKLEKRMVYNALDTYLERKAAGTSHYLFINTAPYATLDEQDYNDIRDRYFSHMRVVFEVVERKKLDPEEIRLRKSIVTKAGAKFALDDFGSGYSNHLALLALEPDIIKIDRELVTGIHRDLRKQHMLEDIITYARYRGTRVLAEGVELREELETLCRMGIDYVQGYFTGRPSPVLADGEESACRVIKSVGRANHMFMKQIFIIFEKSLALADANLAQNASMSSYLVMKMARELGYEGDRLTGLVITTMLHHIGFLYPDCRADGLSSGSFLTRHCIFAYLMIKEYFPYAEYATSVLYHHKKYGEKVYSEEGGQVPDEAYLIGLADEVFEMVSAEPFDLLDEKVKALFDRDDFMPEQVEVLRRLVKEGLLNRLVTGEYHEELLEGIGSMKVGKAESESVLRTFVYAIMFCMPNYYSHARTMEIIVSMMSRFTRQNWKLVERIRIAALIYNLNMLGIPPQEFERAGNPEEEHRLISLSLQNIIKILKKTDLPDVCDMFQQAMGYNKTAQRESTLMGKDIEIGSNMLVLSDLFASMVENRPNRPALTCRQAVDYLKTLAEKNKLQRPLIEIMEDYLEDIEARIESAQTDISKRYQSILANYARMSAAGGQDRSELKKSS